MTRIEVRRSPRDTGNSGWNAILAERSPTAPLDEAITADWLVIGAGFAGLAAARRLLVRRRGERIVVLDAVRIGEGPVGRNSGFMIDLPHDVSSKNYAGALEDDRRRIAANRAAITFAEEAAREYGMAEEAFRRSGKTNGAASEKGSHHNTDFARHLERLGEPFERLDARAMREITGSAYYRDGLHTPHAAMIQPALYARSLADGLRAQGVVLHENSPVTALTREGGSWTAHTAAGSVTAPTVLLAVNGHAESFGFFRRRFVHILLYASMTRALSPEEAREIGGEPRWGVTPADPMGSTVRRISGTGGDRIILRNRVTYAPSMEVSEAQVAQMGATHDSSFLARFPAARSVAMEHRWAGRLCLSRNGAPAFGEIDENLFVACCQNGLGAAHGTLSGMAAADLATGTPSELADHLLSRGTPNRLPPEPLASIGANLTLYWRELRAGRER